MLDDFSTSRTSGTILSTTSHLVTLTGLAPETPYYFRVHSTDVAGNGPTVAPEEDLDPLKLTTLPEPDVTAPDVVEGPFIQSLDDVSATLKWRTNEPATSRIAFGTSQSNLSRAVSSPKLTNEHTHTHTACPGHHLSLLGLQCRRPGPRIGGKQNQDLHHEGNARYQATQNHERPVFQRAIARGLHHLDHGRALQLSSLRQRKTVRRRRQHPEP